MFEIIIVVISLTLGTQGKPENAECIKDYLVKQIERNLADLKSMQSSTLETTRSAEKYLRWGRTTCDEGASLIYDGFAAGKAYNEGGSGANFLCLPKDPEWKEYSDDVNNYRGRLYGVEYEIGNLNKPYPSSFHDKDMPCAVCLTDRRSTVLMVPGRVSCYNGWHKEYSGYLMSQMIDNSRTSSEYICVDENLESVPGGDASRNQAVVLTVEATCGNLKCPLYVNGRELTCVVCSK